MPLRLGRAVSSVKKQLAGRRVVGVGPDQERSFQGAGEADRRDRMSSDEEEENSTKGNEQGGRLKVIWGVDVFGITRI